MLRPLINPPLSEFTQQTVEVRIDPRAVIKRVYWKGQDIGIISWHKVGQHYKWSITNMTVVSNYKKERLAVFALWRLWMRTTQSH